MVGRSNDERVDDELGLAPTVTPSPAKREVEAPTVPIPPGQIPTTPGHTPAPEVRQRPLPEVGFESWDRYDVQELIGRGGMGQVFRARDRTLNRPVALRVRRYSP